MRVLDGISMVVRILSASEGRPTKEDMDDSKNAGVLFLDENKVLVRMAEVREYDLSAPNELPKEIENLILTVRSKYSYLYK